MIIIAGSVLAVGAVIAALVWGFSRGSSRNAPLIEADTRPIKVRPDNPGGLRVPNQDELIFDRNRGGRTASPGALAPEAENPRVDQLRQQLAERAAQEAARSAPPPAATTPGPAQPAAPQAAPRSAPQATAPATPAPPATTSALTAPSLPAPVPASAERFAPVANGRAQVQLGALPSEAAARGEWDRLQKRVPELLGNRRVSLAPLDREGQTTMYRIRTGGFADAATARAFCDEMKTRSIPCMVIGG
ncbi:MAG: SPOR domain-containing protein [Roseomonas sp.]|nr:SPOR domain-containing protein [Roseomonas sp.]MCA3285979.1 SPOR domain-containing protein [Roseomonas sp.]MCA3290596.1 SPOR domain-containing protein [Roseomonas sp.]MCA3293701.1 SPOR domain-containing protein [Roseomonas sp.]